MICSISFYVDLTAGGVDVDAAFEAYLRDQLSVLRDRDNIPTALLEVVRHMPETLMAARNDFELNTKRVFEYPSGSYEVRVGPENLNSPEQNILQGVLSIPG